MTSNDKSPNSTSDVTSYSQKSAGSGRLSEKKGGSGSTLTADIILELSNGPTRLWRMNAGMGWAGVLVSSVRGRVVLANARPFHGMPENWPDVGGFTQDKASGLAIPVYIEVKYGKDRSTKGQREFLEFLRSMGCRAGVARSVEDARRIVAGDV